MLQPPTISGLRVRTPAEANILFHAVSTGLLPMVTRRLDNEERRAITSGSVFIWEERGPHAELTGLGIERWTDSISWGPSRVRDDFLFYQEQRRNRQGANAADREPASDSDTTTSSHRRRDPLVKQTYSVFVDTPRGRRKWHMIAYFIQDTMDQLRTIDDFPHLGALVVPPGTYTPARISRAKKPHEPPRRAREESDFPLPRARAPAGGQLLAPLEYLRTCPPPRRHIIDEMALMSFDPR